MSNPHSKWLHKCIVNILIPALEEQGFEWKKQKPTKEIGREMALGWPFGSMRRRSKNSMDIVEIQLKKRDRSFFALEIGSCPLDGARDYLQGKHYEADEISVGFLEESWVLCRCPRFYSYFGFGFKSFRNITETDYEQLVRRVISYFPEFEEALSTGKHCQHIGFVKKRRQYEPTRL